MKRDKLTLKHIEAFRAVIATGSASRAAVQLGISQPAISKIIAQAELLAGTTLFERRLGRLIPTPQSLMLYSETNVLFATIEGIDDIVDRVIKREVQPIALGSVPLLSTTLLPRVLPKWRLDTGRTLLVHTYDAPSLSSLLAAQRLEFAVTIAMQHTHGSCVTPLLRSPLFCALPRSHRLAHKRVITPEDLHGENYVALSKSEGVRGDIDRAFAMTNAMPTEVMQVPMMSAAVRMAEEGAGFAFVDVFGLHSAHQQKLVFRRFEPRIYFDYCAVWLEHREPDFNRANLVTSLKRTSLQMQNEAETLLDAN